MNEKMTTAGKYETANVDTDALFSVFRRFPRTTRALAESRCDDDFPGMCDRLRGAYLRRIPGVRNSGCTAFVPGDAYMILAAASWHRHAVASRATTDREHEHATHARSR
jgi:hypothetical protein